MTGMKEYGEILTGESKGTAESQCHLVGPKFRMKWCEIEPVPMQ